jgi:hypothetical protein
MGMVKVVHFDVASPRNHDRSSAAARRPIPMTANVARLRRFQALALRCFKSHSKHSVSGGR